MSRIRFYCAMIAAILVLPVHAAAQKNEIGASIGRMFISDQGVLGANPADPHIHFGNGLTYEANYGRRLVDLGIIGVSAEVPFVFTPSVRMHFEEQIVPKNYRSYFLTPAARVHLFPSTAFSPWISAGGGFAHFSESSELEFGVPNPGPRGTSSGVFEVGVGLDVRILEGIKIRGEARDFNSGVPQLNANTGKTRQHNIFAGGGVVFSF